MLQLENKTPLLPAMAVLPNADGIDTLYVVAKATLNLRPKLGLASIQMPPSLTDEYHADPAASSLKLASEMHIGKPGTDVLIVGSAWIPHGHSAPETMVNVVVAERRKSIRVLGDRVWRNGRPSAPQPFQSIPMVWERAYGGVQQVGDRLYAEERNPVGTGFTQGRKADEMEGKPLPNLEDPSTPISSLGQNATPACFAPIAASWLPRRHYAGTYDANWQKKRAPYLPKDFDSRFLQCAVAEFAFNRFLQGNEPVSITGMSPDGPIEFHLPASPLSVEVTIAGAAQHPAVNLETVLIEPDLNRVSLSYRAMVNCDRRALRVERVELTLKRAGARN